MKKLEIKTRKGRITALKNATGTATLYSYFSNDREQEDFCSFNLYSFYEKMKKNNVRATKRDLKRIEVY